MYVCTFPLEQYEALVIIISDEENMKVNTNLRKNKTDFFSNEMQANQMLVMVTFTQPSGNKFFYF